MLKIREGFKGERALAMPVAALKFMESNALTSLLYITNIGYYPCAKHHYRQRTEPIDQWIFIYCVDGKGSYQTDGAVHHITANQYLVIPANTKHIYQADQEDPWTIYWIHFKGDLASEIERAADTPQPIVQSPDSRIGDRISLFEEIFHTLELGFSPQNLQLSSSALIYFFGTLLFVNEYRRAVATPKSDNIIALSAHYIRENLNKKISVKDLASFFGYSTSYLSAIFRREIATSPTEYINAIKIRESCRFLDFTDMRVNQICPKVGITDSYYFTRLFTKIMGLSPTQYRRQKKG